MNVEPEAGDGRRWPVPSETVIRLVVLAILIAGLVLVLVVGARIYVLSQNDQAQAERIGRLEGTNAAQDEALAEANRRLEKAGEAPVEVPPTATPEQGEQGEPGETGETGDQGPRGPAGATGPQGEDGRDGKRGPRGFTGLDGPAGPQGPAGQDGAVGPQGQQGPQGERGPAGQDGADGATGPQGPAGTAQPGVYQCPDGQVLTGFTVTGSGNVLLSCQQGVILPKGGR